jgi:cysteine desulfurase
VPTALCVGFGSACALAKNRMDEDTRHSIGLRTLLIKLLSSSLEGFQVNGSLDSRLPGNLNILIEGVDAEVLLSRMPDVAMSTGSACSSASIEPSHVLLAMGLTREQAESSIRIGFGRGTTAQEIEAAVARLAGEVQSLRLAALSLTVKRGVAKRIAR